MTINCQFGNVDADGAAIRARAASLDAEHQAIVRDVVAARNFWRSASLPPCREFKVRGGNIASNYGGYFKRIHSVRS
jgi:hypothetical protein